MRQAGHVVFGSVLGSAGDLGASVDAGGRLAEMGERSHSTLRVWDPLVRLRLRRAPGRLRERSYDGAPRQLDLEIVVAEATRAAQHNFGRRREALARGRRSGEASFGVRIAPWLMCDPAEREPRFSDRVALELKANRNRDQRECI